MHSVSMAINILDLPVEILDKICHYLVTSEDLPALSCTCTRFCDIASRLKFHTIEFSIDGAYIPGLKATIDDVDSICEILLGEGDNIRDVFIDNFDYDDEEDSDALVKLALELENLERLVIEVSDYQVEELFRFSNEIVISAPTILRVELLLDDYEKMELLWSLVQCHPNMRLEIVGASRLDPMHLTLYMQSFQKYLTHVDLIFNTPGTPISKVNEFLLGSPNLQTVGLSSLHMLKNDVRLLVMPENVTRLELRLSRKVRRPFGITGENLDSVKCNGNCMENITIEKAITYLALSWQRGAFDPETISNYSSSFPIPTIEIEAGDVSQLEEVGALTCLASDALKIRTLSIGDKDYYSRMARALPRTSDITALIISLPVHSQEKMTSYLASIALRFPRLSSFDVMFGFHEFPRAWGYQLFHPLGYYNRVNLAALKDAIANDADSCNYKL
ncbi:hypothetical protein TRVA0_032S00540 [Trichomonascus vanleenenianus]|uniref:F-box protein n=1 Tax=Trichomonascus vanleenenianus TaxID=2268995 RepID=UPI003ECACAF6